jgi:hypothetical protein
MPTTKSAKSSRPTPTLDTFTVQYMRLAKSCHYATSLESSSPSSLAAGSFIKSATTASQNAAIAGPLPRSGSSARPSTIARHCGGSRRAAGARGSVRGAAPPGTQDRHNGLGGTRPSTKICLDLEAPGPPTEYQRSGGSRVRHACFEIPCSPKDCSKGKECSTRSK